MTNHLRITRIVGSVAGGCTVGLFGRGMYERDPVFLSLAFIFLAIAWLYREMYLGWNEQADNWKFLSRQAIIPGKKES